jgi:hypothetical protein
MNQRRVLQRPLVRSCHACARDPEPTPHFPIVPDTRTSAADEPPYGSVGLGSGVVDRVDEFPEFPHSIGRCARLLSTCTRRHRWSLKASRISISVSGIQRLCCDCHSGRIEALLRTRQTRRTDGTGGMSYPCPFACSFCGRNDADRLDRRWSEDKWGLNVSSIKPILVEQSIAACLERM